MLVKHSHFWCFEVSVSCLFWWHHSRMCQHAANLSQGKQMKSNCHRIDGDETTRSFKRTPWLHYKPVLHCSCSLFQCRQDQVTKHKHHSWLILRMNSSQPKLPSDLTRASSFTFISFGWCFCPKLHTIERRYHQAGLGFLKASLGQESLKLLRKSHRQAHVVFLNNIVA